MVSLFASVNAQKVLSIDPDWDHFEMTASLLGTTGNWGVPLDGTGLPITGLALDFVNW